MKGFTRVVDWGGREGGRERGREGERGRRNKTSMDWL
jgi:hypothetical protein